MDGWSILSAILWRCRQRRDIRDDKARETLKCVCVCVCCVPAGGTQCCARHSYLIAAGLCVFWGASCCGAVPHRRPICFRDGDNRGAHWKTTRALALR